MLSARGRRLAEEKLIALAWNRIRSHLELRRDQIHEEMGNYPKPIPACDLQFNALLEERSRISRELGEVNRLSEQRLATQEHIAAIYAFIASSAFILGDTEREIGASIDTLRVRAE